MIKPSTDGTFKSSPIHKTHGFRQKLAREQGGQIGSTTQLDRTLKAFLNEDRMRKTYSLPSIPDVVHHQSVFKQQQRQKKNSKSNVMDESVKSMDTLKTIYQSLWQGEYQKEQRERLAQQDVRLLQIIDSTLQNFYVHRQWESDIKSIKEYDRRQSKLIRHK